MTSPQEAVSYTGPIGVDHVNWLLKTCDIFIQEESRILTLKQCSSSLFVLMFQRMFYKLNVDREPNTAEKKRYNVSQVLSALEVELPADLSFISAKEVVALNEDHIRMLIRIFFNLALKFVHIGTVVAEEENEEKVKLIGHATNAQDIGTSTPTNVLNGLLLSAATSSTQAQELKLRLNTNQVRLMSNNVMSGIEEDVPQTTRNEGNNIRHINTQHPEEFFTNMHTISSTKHPTTVAVQEVMKSDVKIIKKPDNNTSLEDRRGDEGVATKIKIEGDDKNILRDRGKNNPTGDEDVDDPSSVDSAVLTQNKVANWKEGIVPPPPTPSARFGISRRHGHPNNNKKRHLERNQEVQEGVVDIQERIRIMEQLTGPKQRPVVHSTRPRTKLILPTYHQSYTRIDTVSRDKKIETLRVMKFVDDLHRQVRSILIHDGSHQELSLQKNITQSLQQQRLHNRELQSYIRDEDVKLRGAMVSLSCSAKQTFDTAMKMLSEKSCQMELEHRLSVKECNDTARRRIQEDKRLLEERRNRYVDALCSWKRAAFFA